MMPILVIGSLSTFISMPSVNAPNRIAASLMLSILVPLVLEWTGVLPRTYFFVGNAIAFQPWAIDFTPMAMIVSTVAVLVVQMIVTSSIHRGQRRSQEQAHERVHVHSWHLD